MTTLKRIQPGIYETPDGTYRVFKDGYEPVRDTEPPDGRFRTGYYDFVHLGPEEVAWIIVKTSRPEDNLAITDTLREAKTWIKYHGYE